MAWVDIPAFVVSVLIAQYYKNGYEFLSKRTVPDGKNKGSQRNILVTSKLVRDLEEYQKVQSCYANTLGDKFINKHNLLFANTWGKPVDTSNFTTRYFKKILAQADLDRKFKFHDLRHTHATLLLRQGVNIKVSFRTFRS